MTKLAYSRLLFGDFLLDDVDEKDVVEQIKTLGVTEQLPKDNGPSMFQIQNITEFIAQLEKTQNSHDGLFQYIKDARFWIYRDGILPIKVVVIEVVLKTDDLQKLKKSDLEGKIWKVSLLLGSCFSEGSIPIADSSKDFRILKFSSRAIPNVVLRNFVAEFVIETEREFFDDFNKELDSLEKEISIRDLIEQKVIEARENCKIPADEVDKVISKGTLQQEQKIKDIRTKIISLEPVSFLEGGFSYEQSIVRGYANKMFIIGKIVQGSLGDSPPLYLCVLSMGGSQIPLANLESMPVLQFPERPSLLDFSFGAGQILALQLLNSWNRHVEKLVTEITTKQSPSQTNANTDANKTLEELRDLIFHTGINEKISVNYRRELQDLANPSRKTFLYEFPIPPEEATLYSTNPEQYGLEKPGPIASNLASLVLKDLNSNEKHLLGATDLRKSKIDVLKIEEDRKYSRRMLCLTVVIAVATIVNVVLFLIRL
ncbi:hypothetical protein [Cuniculiplasma divulgatum]|uniref:hypothetical protein n=1 Tax=Cuniculiplasma divulgatum TaxID=1673428 RepID=UPI0011E5F9FC|nr:hypothetical protein [Cuniculiplasma divulgatum]